MYAASFSFLRTSFVLHRFVETVTKRLPNATPAKLPFDRQCKRVGLFRVSIHPVKAEPTQRKGHISQRTDGQRANATPV